MEMIPLQNPEFSGGIINDKIELDDTQLADLSKILCFAQ